MYSLSPSLEVVDALRTTNVIIGFITCFVLLACLSIPRRLGWVETSWGSWTTSIRLGWMSLFLFAFTGTYSTFEIIFLETYFRVPMVTVALIWGIMSVLWPSYESWKNQRNKKSR